MDRRIRVSLSDDGFRPHPTRKTPLIGRLTPAMTIRLRAIYSIWSVPRAREMAGLDPAQPSARKAARKAAPQRPVRYLFRRPQKAYTITADRRDRRDPREELIRP